MDRFIFAFLFILPFSCFSQGLNNDFKYDQADIDELFKMNHIDVYKFPLSCQDSASRYNFILYYYQDGKLVDSLDYSLIMQAEGLWLDSIGTLKDTISSSDLGKLVKNRQTSIESSQVQNPSTGVVVPSEKKKSAGKGALAENKDKEEPLSQLLQTIRGEENILRIYIKYEKTNIILNITLNQTTITETLDFNEKIYGSRAMLKKTDKIEEKTRLLTIYGTDQNRILHCAQNDSDNLLKKRMNELYVLYLERIK